MTKNILEYIAERYVHMCGYWFVKFIKNNRNKSLGETKAMAAPTRAKVAHKYVESKSIAKALKKSKEMDSVADGEKNLWDCVAKSVLEYENEEDNGDANVSDEEINYEIDK